MTERAMSGVAQPAATPISPGDLVIARLKDARKRLGWSTTHLAEQLATAGAPKLTANILQNLEAGRRQQTVTVEELLLLAMATHVPPEFFLAAGDNQRIQLVPGVVVDAEQLLAWVRGEQPLPVTDPARYQQATTEALGDRAGGASAGLRAEFLQRASAAFDGFFADSEEITRKTREQVRHLLTELRAAVEAGASTEELFTQLDGYLTNLSNTP
jgi:transcriptional regulator with XRE-family HTH domain